MSAHIVILRVEVDPARGDRGVDVVSRRERSSRRNVVGRNDKGAEEMEALVAQAAPVERADIVGCVEREHAIGVAERSRGARVGVGRAAVVRHIESRGALRRVVGGMTHIPRVALTLAERDPLACH